MNFAVDHGGGASASHAVMRTRSVLQGVAIPSQAAGDENDGLLQPFVNIEAARMELEAKRDDAEDALVVAGKKFRAAEIRLIAAKGALLVAKAKHEAAVFVFEGINDEIEGAIEAQRLMLEAGTMSIRDQLEERMFEEEAA